MKKRFLPILLVLSLLLCGTVSYGKELPSLSTAKINELQEQLRTCIQALDRIKVANAPAPSAPKAAPAPKTAPAAESVNPSDVADEIAMNLEALVGTTNDEAPKAPPKPPVTDAATSKFSSLNLQFGRNYDLGK